MNLRNTKAGVVITVLLLMLGACQSSGPVHEHHGDDALPAECERAEVLPSVRCASAASTIFGPDGRLWLVWAQAGHVYVSSSSDRGKTFKSAAIVNKNPEDIAAKGENRPKIVINREHGVFVSWTQKTKSRFSGHIRFSYSSDGKIFSDPVTINDDLADTSHRFDSLGVNGRGEIYITWLDKRDRVQAESAGRAYAGAALYYAVSRDGGKSFDTNRKIIDHTCECCRIALAMDKNQMPVLFWRHVYGDNIRDHALIRLDAIDVPKEVVRVSYDNWQVDACPHHGPALSIGEDGVYHLTWFNNAPERHGLFYAHSVNRGKTFSAPIVYGNYQAGAEHPAIFSLGNRVWLAWQEFNGIESELHVMASVNGGKSWSKSERVATTSSSTDYPFLLTDGEFVYVVWQSIGKDFRLLPVSGVGR